MARKTGSHAEITGPRIRAAALELFARHGYAAVSMRQIAAEVGVQAGALYTYTADKQSLLFELMRNHMEHLLGCWEEEPRPDDPLACLEAFTRFHIRYHLDRPDEVFISYMELRNLEPEHFAVIEGLRRRYERELEAILASGREDGCFTVPDTKVATMGLIAMLTGIGTWFRDTGRLSRFDVEQLYWDMVRGAVGVPDAAAGPGRAGSGGDAALSAAAE
ncbi:TetR/AcrR family transcriptional regulator [Tropicimonas sediminicola]|uniref:Transcriptional regulator, TetR family n=1 Tax=Tropicimonas sediminicola TaxID=1031541 RepID=A0A239EVN4_9RHOB|nr:TetR/AcrR family transcriptional regulator [Tropicimonas sediminicola]SNS47962.1 transcriptional regulator, TetR family [Tropicimonas sediminicola]